MYTVSPFGLHRRFGAKMVQQSSSLSLMMINDFAAMNKKKSLYSFTRE